MAKTTTTEDLFECDDLGLCVLDAMVEQGLVKAETMIPSLAPPEDADLEDESESWRDRVVSNQTAPISALISQLGRNKDKIARVEAIIGAIANVAEIGYEPNIYSLRGIERCTSLRTLDLWSRESKLDLSPLTKLPALRELDLTCASDVQDLTPLLEIPKLEKLKLATHATVAPQLKKRLEKRGVKVTGPRAKRKSR
jgi:hypothetical protein